MERERGSEGKWLRGEEAGRGKRVGDEGGGREEALRGRGAEGERGRRRGGGEKGKEERERRKEAEGEAWKRRRRDEQERARGGIKENQRKRLQKKDKEKPHEERNKCGMKKIHCQKEKKGCVGGEKR